MRNRSFKTQLMMVLTTLSLALSSQNIAKDIFQAKEIVWYGLNFTEAKMVGSFDQAFGAGDAGASEIKTRWMPSWNALIVTEPQNYKLKEAFDKESIYYDIAPSEKANQSVKTSELMRLNAYSFDDPQKAIKAALSRMGTGEKKAGIGATFVVESFNKTTDEATVYVVLFDIKTKAVLISEKISGKPTGIGLRNFWAGAMKQVIKQIQKTYYPKWQAANK